jgi:hypothetical protein
MRHKATNRVAAVTPPVVMEVLRAPVHCPDEQRPKLSSKGLLHACCSRIGTRALGKPCQLELLQGEGISGGEPWRQQMHPETASKQHPALRGFSLKLRQAGCHWLQGRCVAPASVHRRGPSKSAPKKSWHCLWLCWLAGQRHPQSCLGPTGRATAPVRAEDTRRGVFHALGILKAVRRGVSLAGLLCRQGSDCAG